MTVEEICAHRGFTRHGGEAHWPEAAWPDGAVHGEADRFLQKHDGSGTQRTYAYLLVDHLRWLERVWTWGRSSYAILSDIWGSSVRR